LRRSSIGIIYTGRSVDQGTSATTLHMGDGAGRNDAFGADGTFVFGSALSINSYWARAHTTGNGDVDGTSYRVQTDYAGDRYGLQVERLVVGRHFDPQVGFLRRSNFRKSAATARFSPRPVRSRRIRKFQWIGSIAAFENGSGQLETRLIEGQFGIDFQNSDRFSIRISHDDERVSTPFAAVGLVVPAGSYRFANTAVSYVAGPQHKLAGTLALEHGGYYGGERTTVGVSASRVSIGHHFALEPTVSLNWLDLPGASTVARLLGARATYAVTPRMFMSAFVQCNSTLRTTATNARLRWEYQPGSELFVVYNEERHTLATELSQLATRALVIKFNRLFRF
jgi:hypothetical protein